MTTPLFLGRVPGSKEDVTLAPSQLRTHGVVVGMTGSGKTGLCLVMLEELIRAGIPILAIDPKGDLGNLGLIFEGLEPTHFEAWAPGGDARALAERWKTGIADWNLTPEDVTRLRQRMQFQVYTPGSEAGIPVNLLGAFSRPAEALLEDSEARRELVASTISGLLGLVDCNADPVKDPEHIVLAHILERAWLAGEDPTLETLILQLVDPPFEKIGVFPVDRFFKPDARMNLAMRFNGVVASPSFAPWTRGISLDLDRMLEPADRVPVHVFSLAHLTDSERQFFLSLLLGQLLAWSRRQPGTEALRAVLFFDEVAGYLPPYPANPPTKAPLLTMMKQARAVGFGVLLATQNPVDLDYKALSNAGLWCIGRLGTAQDRDRLLKGISGTHLDATVAGLKKREFLLYVAGKDQPRVLTTRHAMCYLRGPFTRIEIKALNAEHGAAVTRAEAGSSASVRHTGSSARGSSDEGRRASELDSSGLLSAAPSVTGTPSFYLDPRVTFSARLEGLFQHAAEPARQDGRLVYHPALLADLSLRFDEDRVGFILDHHELRVWFPLESGRPDEHVHVRLEDSDLQSQPEKAALFVPLPSWMDETGELKRIASDVVEEVFRNETRGMFVHRSLKLYGRPGEARASFADRCRQAVDERIDGEEAKLRERYAQKFDRLRDRISRVEARLAELQGVAQARQMEEAVTWGTTLFGLFTGKKRSLGGAVSKRSQTSRANQRLSTEERELVQLQEEAETLEQELTQAIQKVRDDETRALDQIEEQEVRLEKSDIRLERFALLWVPVTRRV